MKFSFECFLLAGGLNIWISLNFFFAISTISLKDDPIKIFDTKLPCFVSILTEKFNAVTLVKIASEILGGKGGGGRKDFAQAGGSHKDKIEEALNTIKRKIN